MDLAKLGAVVRPRSAWEAIDLGFALCRAQWRPLLRAWLVVALPLLGAVWLFLGQVPLLAFLAVWWLKPLLGVLPLFALSRALFGAAPDLGESLRAWPGLWARFLLPALVPWRLDPRRAYRAPVWVLEGLRGRARRRRLDLLASGQDLPALGLVLSCWLLEQCWFAALLTGAWTLLHPGRGFELGELLQALGEDPWPGWLYPLLAGAHLGAITLSEPFHVAGGFALYVNRRVQLEGWDLELAFRQLAARLRAEQAEEAATERLARAASSRRAAAQVALPLLLAALLLLPGAARAQEPPRPPGPDPEQVAQEVLKDPVFGHERKVRRRVQPGRPAQQSPGQAPDAAAGAAAEVLRLLAISGVTLLGAGLLYLVLRASLQAASGPARTRAGRALPAVLMGLDLRPESLPRDVPGEARRLWGRGEHARALSLLYRGALARLVSAHRLELPPSATEGDCLEAVRRARGPAPWFARLTAAWQSVAYAGRIPPEDEVLGLCADWPRDPERRT